MHYVLKTVSYNLQHFMVGLYDTKERTFFDCSTFACVISYNK